MTTRRYSISRFSNVRQHERIEVTTDVDLLNEFGISTAESEAAFDAWLTEHGEVLGSEVFDSADDPQIAIEIEETEEVEAPLLVPYPPTTVAQAEAWVAWAETEIGVGWHPDTSGDEMMEFDPIGLEAKCACGETFIPADVTDTTHFINDKGEECGLLGMITGTWSRPNGKPLFPDPDVRARYDAGLDAAHELLPDIYATSMSIFQQLHPELLPPEGKDTP